MQLGLSGRNCDTDGRNQIIPPVRSFVCFSSEWSRKTRFANQIIHKQYMSVMNLFELNFYFYFYLYFVLHVLFLIVYDVV